jgi:hypothetical protein
MAITVDTAIEAVRTDTSTPFTWSHTGAASGVKAVVVTAVHGVSSTDHISAVSYGGTAMARVQRNTDTSTEPGAAEVWCLVNSAATIPQGTQTVSVTCGATTDDFHFVSITLLATGDYVTVVSRDGVSNDVANPSVTLPYGGATCMSFAALYGGGADGSVFTPNANCTTIHDHDLGAFFSEVIRQTTAGSSDFAIGGTSVSDDVAFAAVALTDTQRFYFPAATAADVTPAANGAWGDTASALNRKLARTKTGSATSGTGLTWSTGVTKLDRRYVSDPLGAQTISGNVRMQMRAVETNADDNAVARLELYVVSNDGSSVIGTLLAIGDYSTGTELAGVGSFINKTFADGDALSSLAISDGDRLVVALGYSDAAGTTPGATTSFDGSNYPDLPFNETDTNALPGWIQFTSALTFSVGGGASDILDPFGAAGFFGI